MGLNADILWDYFSTIGSSLTRRRLGLLSPNSQERSPEETIVDLARDRRVEIEYFDVRGLDIFFEDRFLDLQPDF
ncbi:MAG: hypothetical protein AAFY57_07640 [Cyanobacteria bacterium J06642_2]